MIIGLVREVKDSEDRVGLILEVVRVYVKVGYIVLVESGVGKILGFSDVVYKKRGVLIIESVKEVWCKLKMIIKVKELVCSEYLFIRIG